MGGKANPGNLWALAPAGSRRPAARTQRLQGLVGAIVPICLILAAAVLVTLPATLAPSARLTLFIFSLVVILWSTTDFNITHVALMAMVLMALGGASRQDQIIEALASDGIWLLIGASILGGAVQQTGLAVRLIQRVVARAYCARGVPRVDYRVAATLFDRTFAGRPLRNRDANFPQPGARRRWRSTDYTCLGPVNSCRHSGDDYRQSARSGFTLTRRRTAEPDCPATTFLCRVAVIRTAVGCPRQLRDRVLGCPRVPGQAASRTGSVGADDHLTHALAS